MTPGAGGPGKDEVEMETYIGTKIVSAEPKTNEAGSPGYTVVYEDGYRSWSPREVFERCYRLVTVAERALLT